MIGFARTGRPFLPVFLSVLYIIITAIRRTCISFAIKKIEIDKHNATCKLMSKREIATLFLNKYTCTYISN